MGSFRALNILLKTISQSGKASFKTDDQKNASVKLCDPATKNDAYHDSNINFSASKENEKDLLNRVYSRPQISIFGNGRIKTRSNKIKSSNRAASEAQPSLDLTQNKEKYNLENHSMKEIVDSELFSKKLPDSWKNPDTAPGPCQRYCKVK